MTELEGIAGCLVAPAQATYAVATLNGDLIRSTEDISYTVAAGMLLFHKEREDAATAVRGTKRHRPYDTKVDVVAHMGDAPDSKLTLYGVSTAQVSNGRLAKDNPASVGTLSAMTSGAVTIFARCKDAIPGDELYVSAEYDADAKYVGLKDFRFPRFTSNAPTPQSAFTVDEKTKHPNGLPTNPSIVLATAASYAAYTNAIGDSPLRTAAHVAAEHGAICGGQLEAGVEQFVMGLHPDARDGPAAFTALLEDIKAHNIAAYSKNAPLLGTMSDFKDDLGVIQEAGGKLTAAEKKTFRSPRTLGNTVANGANFSTAESKGYIHAAIAAALSTKDKEVATSMHADTTFTKPTSTEWSTATVADTTFQRRLTATHAEFMVPPNVDTAKVLATAEKGVIRFAEGGTMSADFFRAVDGMPGVVSLKVGPATVVPTEATFDTKHHNHTTAHKNWQRVGIVVANDIKSGSIRVLLNIIPATYSSVSSNVWLTETGTAIPDTEQDLLAPSVAPQQAVYAQCNVNENIREGDLLFQCTPDLTRPQCYTVTRKRDGGYPFFGVAAENIIKGETPIRTTAIIAGAVTVHDTSCKNWKVNSMLVAETTPLGTSSANGAFWRRALLVKRYDVEPFLRGMRGWMAAGTEQDHSVIGRVLTRDQDTATILIHRGRACLPKPYDLLPDEFYSITTREQTQELLYRTTAEHRTTVFNDVTRLRTRKIILDKATSDIPLNPTIKEGVYILWGDAASRTHTINWDELSKGDFRINLEGQSGNLSPNNDRAALSKLPDGAAKLEKLVSLLTP